MKIWERTIRRKETHWNLWSLIASDKAVIRIVTPSSNSSKIGAAAKWTDDRLFIHFISSLDWSHLVILSILVASHVITSWRPLKNESEGIRSSLINSNINNYFLVSNLSDTKSFTRSPTHIDNKFSSLHSIEVAPIIVCKFQVKCPKNIIKLVFPHILRYVCQYLKKGDEFGLESIKHWKCKWTNRWGPLSVYGVLHHNQSLTSFHPVNTMTFVVQEIKAIIGNNP